MGAVLSTLDVQHSGDWRIHHLKPQPHYVKMKPPSPFLPPWPNPRLPAPPPPWIILPLIAPLPASPLSTQPTDPSFPQLHGPPPPLLPPTVQPLSTTTTTTTTTTTAVALLATLTASLIHLDTAIHLHYHHHHNATARLNNNNKIGSDASASASAEALIDLLPHLLDVVWADVHALERAMVAVAS